MNLFNKYCYKHIAGILSSLGANPFGNYMVPNVFSLHNFATKNAKFVRRAPRMVRPSIMTHRSRATVKY